jgi:hypothetical protein
MHKKPPNTQQHKPSCDSMSPENASWQGGPSPPQVVIQRHHQRQRHNGGATVTWRGPGRSHGEAPCRWDGFTALRNAIFWPIYFKPSVASKAAKRQIRRGLLDTPILAGLRKTQRGWGCQEGHDCSGVPTIRHSSVVKFDCSDWCD